MDNRVLFGVMCIIFNSIGVPCFMQKQIKTGIMRIVLGIVSCGVIAIINMVKGIILGINVLKMSDEDLLKITLSTLKDDMVIILDSTEEGAEYISEEKQNIFQQIMQ